MASLFSQHYENNSIHYAREINLGKAGMYSCLLIDYIHVCITVCSLKEMVIRFTLLKWNLEKKIHKIIVFFYLTSEANTKHVFHEIGG